MSKDAGSPQVQEHNKYNYLFRYYQECRKNDTHALPIFNKIKDKRLDLRGYVINDGVCKAFGEAVKLCPELLESLILEDN